MPQIRPALALLALCLGGALALAGCGDQNSKASFSSTTGNHVPGWLASGHSQSAKADVNSCVDCHGENLDGGISQFAYARHAQYVAANTTATCAVAACHGTNLQGGVAPSCGINCHMAADPVTGAPQKHAWLATNTAENLDGHLNYFANNPRNYDSCRNHACHGGEGTNATPPGVFLSGPGCLNVGCHGPGNPVPAEAP